MASFTIKEVASALQCDVRRLKGKDGRPSRERWPFSTEKGRGGSKKVFEHTDLPEPVRKALATTYPDRIAPETPDAAPGFTPPKKKTALVYDREALWANYERKTAGQKNKAHRKMAILSDAMSMVDAGLGVTDAIKAVSKKYGTAVGTINNWYYGKGKKHGVIEYDRADWLAALVNNHIGNTDNKWSPEAWAWFKGAYLRPEQPSIAYCHDELARIAVQHGWTHPGKSGCERAVRDYISVEVRVLMREGEAALGRMFPSVQRTVRDVHAMQWISGDGYLHNVFVRFRDGSVGRPKTWFWQDVRSRKLLAWRTDVSENSWMIRLAFGDLVDSYGIPEHITIDNTRAAANKWLTGGVPNRYRFKVREDEPLGVFAAIGCQVHWTSIVHGEGRGQAKPVERAFGVGGIGERVDKHPRLAGAYTGTSPMDKPDNYGEKVIDIDEFEDVLAEGVRAFNALPNRRTEICAGQMSFDAAFAESYEASRHLIRRATESQRRLWLMPAEDVRVARDSTVVLQIGKGPNGHNRFAGDCLLGRAGDRIIVRFDPADLHSTVHCYTADQVYLGTAQIQEAAGFGDTDAAQRWKRENKRLTKAGKDMAAAEKGMSIAEAADWMARTTNDEDDDAPGNDPTVVRGAFEQPKRVVGSDTTPADETPESQAETRFGWHDVMERELNHLRTNSLGKPTRDDNET